MVIQALGSLVDSVFDFVLGCKLSPLLSRPHSARRCLIAYSYRLSNSRASAGEAGRALRGVVSVARWVGRSWSFPFSFIEIMSRKNWERATLRKE